jgi:hypothetical protein
MTRGMFTVSVSGGEGFVRTGGGAWQRSTR